MTTADDALDDLVAHVDGVLDPATCADACHELRYCHWRTSGVTRRQGSGLVSVRSPARSSVTTGQWWFTPRMLEMVADLEAHLVREYGVDPERLEAWEATRYGPGGAFATHHDAGLWADSPPGDRTRTFLLYLETPTDGGGTEFPLLDRTVEPVAGRLVVWANLQRDGRPDPLLRHAALPVVGGHKTILTTWERERPIRTVKEPAPWTTTASSS